MNINSKRKTLIYISLATILLLLCVAAIFLLLTTAPEPEETSSEASEAFSSAESSEAGEPVSAEESGADSSSDSSSVSGADSSSVSASEADGKFVLGSLPENLTLNSRSALVYSAVTDELLYEKNADGLCYPASLTKLMTAMVALDKLSLDESFTVGNELELVGANSSLAYLNRGQVLTLADLIDALLLPSGNDAAYVIAVGTARKLNPDAELSPREAVAAFCALMNEKATQIGCVGSSFSNPDGYDESGTYTTARDMLKICESAIGYEAIAESASSAERDYSFSDGARILWLNSNLLLQRTSDYYSPYVTGLKTGSTDWAGFCLTVTAEREGEEVIIVLMNSSSNTARYSDATAIIDALFGIYENS